MKTITEAMKELSEVEEAWAEAEVWAEAAVEMAKTLMWAEAEQAKARASSDERVQAASDAWVEKIKSRAAQVTANWTRANAIWVQAKARADAKG
jgi:hypothetical protein